MSPRFLFAFALAVAVCTPVACGDQRPANYARPPSVLSPTEAHIAWTKARDVFETRCVVCHGCYDAPC